MIPVSLVSAFLSLDTAAVFQGLIAQPIVACTLIGWMSNDLWFGLQIGLIMQLIWISSLPIGAVTFPDGNLGSMIAVIVATRIDIENQGFEHLIIFLAVFYGFFMSFIGAHVMKWIRQFNVHLFDYVRRQIARDRFNSVSFSVILSLSFNYISLFVLILSTATVGKWLFEGIIDMASEQWNEFARYTEIAVLGAGFGLTLTLFKENRMKFMIAAGITISLLFLLI
jgi:mannose/fructose/N-acetylgalactosamine-specific phosphotransferase system component IIC